MDSNVEVPAVAGVNGSGDYRFIAAELFDVSARVILWCSCVDPQGPEHTSETDDAAYQDLYDTLSHEVPSGTPLTLLGGGKLSISDTAIVIASRSQNFGQEPDRQTTAKILRQAFPALEVEIMG